MCVGNKENDPDLGNFQSPLKKQELTRRIKVSPDQFFYLQKSDGLWLHSSEHCREHIMATKVVSDGCAERNVKIYPDTEECPRDLLDYTDVAKLNFWLPRFVFKVCKQDGIPIFPEVFTSI